MSYRYKVWALDVWGNEEDGFTVNDRREVGKISVSNTENRTLFRALVNSDYLRPSAKVEFDGDDEFISVDYVANGMPVLQLESEGEFNKRDTGIPGMWDDLGESKPNPLSSLSTGETVGLVAAGVAVVGTIGYFIWKSQKAAAPTAAVMTPTPGTTDQIPPFVPGFQQPTGGQVFDPNLGGSLGGGSGLQPGYQGEVTTPQTQAGIPGIDNLSGTVPGG